MKREKSAPLTENEIRDYFGWTVFAGGSDNPDVAIPLGIGILHEESNVLIRKTQENNINDKLVFTITELVDVTMIIAESLNNRERDLPSVGALTKRFRRNRLFNPESVELGFLSKSQNYHNRWEIKNHEFERYCLELVNFSKKWAESTDSQVVKHQNIPSLKEGLFRRDSAGKRWRKKENPTEEINEVKSQPQGLKDSNRQMLEIQKGEERGVIIRDDVNWASILLKKYDEYFKTWQRKEENLWVLKSIPEPKSNEREKALKPKVRLRLHTEVISIMEGELFRKREDNDLQYPGLVSRFVIESKLAQSGSRISSARVSQIMGDLQALNIVEKPHRVNEKGSRIAYSFHKNFNFRKDEIDILTNRLLLILADNKNALNKFQVRTKEF